LFRPDWPIPGGMPRPVFNSYVNENVCSFWLDVESKLVQNEYWLRFSLSLWPGIEPDLLPSGLASCAGTSDRHGPTHSWAGRNQLQA